VTTRAGEELICQFASLAPLVVCTTPELLSPVARSMAIVEARALDAAIINAVVARTAAQRRIETFSISSLLESHLDSSTARRRDQSFIVAIYEVFARYFLAIVRQADGP
jgi:hypothetical protein